MGKGELVLDFGEISFKDQNWTKQERVENKIYKKLKKHNFKRHDKIENDIEMIKQLINECGVDEEINLISKSFDSPNIVLAILDKIEEIYVSTWAITPAGINSFIELAKTGKCKEAYLFLDNTHSYKWMFSSGAYKVLNDSVHIKFAVNHSKFIVIKTIDGQYINCYGSMNLSNNQRWENITITRCETDFMFYSRFIKEVSAGMV